MPKIITSPISQMKQPKKNQPNNEFKILEKYQISEKYPSTQPMFWIQEKLTKNNLN